MNMCSVNPMKLSKNISEKNFVFFVKPQIYTYYVAYVFLWICFILTYTTHFSEQIWSIDSKKCLHVDVHFDKVVSQTHSFGNNEL